MDSKRKVSRAFNNNPQGSRLRRRPPTKKYCGVFYQQILINSKLQIGRRGPKSETDWEKSIKEAKVRIGL